MALHPYRVYAKTASSHLSNARDWLNSDWTPGRGPTDEEADGKEDALPEDAELEDHDLDCPEHPTGEEEG